MKLHSSTFINILFTVIWGKRIPCLTSVQMGERDLEKEKEMFLLTRHLKAQTWKKNFKKNQRKNEGKGLTTGSFAQGKQWCSQAEGQSTAKTERQEPVDSVTLGRTLPAPNINIPVWKASGPGNGTAHLLTASRPGIRDAEVRIPGSHDLCSAASQTSQPPGPQGGDPSASGLPTPFIRRRVGAHLSS